MIWMADCDWRAPAAQALTYLGHSVGLVYWAFVTEIILGHDEIIAFIYYCWLCNRITNEVCEFVCPEFSLLFCLCKAFGMETTDIG